MGAGHCHAQIAARRSWSPILTANYPLKAWNASWATDLLKTASLLRASFKNHSQAFNCRVYLGLIMAILVGFLLGAFLWFLVRIVMFGIYTVDQNERAVKTSFGRADRVPGGKTTLDDPVATSLRDEERDRYKYPQVRVIPPGGPYFKMPLEKVYKVSIATITVNRAPNPQDPNANQR